MQHSAVNTGRGEVDARGLLRDGEDHGRFRLSTVTVMSSGSADPNG
jgi:hypothetical protein